MTQRTVPSTRPAPQRRPGVRGRVGSAWFGGLTLIREVDGTTTLRGAVTDQTELHGLLAKVRDLGTTLISVKTIEAPGPRQRERA